MWIQPNLTKKNLQEFSEKEFIILLKHAEKRILRVCIDVYKTYGEGGIDKLIESVTRLNKKLKLQNELIEKLKKTDEDFEQNQFS